MSSDVVEIFIPAAEGRAFEAKAGQYITVIDVEGEQIGDFVAFNAHDFNERLSTAHTRADLWRVFVREGDRMMTNLRTPMFEIVEDAVGQHDITIPACDPTRYEKTFGVKGHRNCLDNLSGALEPYGISRWQVPEPFNIFQNSVVNAEGHYDFNPPLSKAGDRLVLRALMDVVGALSACAMDLMPANGYKLTPLRFVISSERP